MRAEEAGKSERQQLCSVTEVEEALDAGRTVRRLFVAKTNRSDRARTLVERCKALGVPVRELFTPPEI